MRPVYAIASNITSPLGMDTAAHWQAAMQGKTGIRKHANEELSKAPFYASVLEPEQWLAVGGAVHSQHELSPFEQLAVHSAKGALAILERNIDLQQTAFILATTKGNIELLGKAPEEHLLLNYSAKKIAAELSVAAAPFTISQACVSGVVALQYGMFLLRSGRFKHAIVTGCDRFTRFVLAGFQCLKAISDEPCRPFDAHRTGITLGEAAATIILSVDKTEDTAAALMSGATTNDANHISGPSKTGEELATAIGHAINDALITPGQVGIISAHGTATLYNDEMEAKAFALAGLLHAPVHSFKGYVGHTLGAAGVLESVMLIESLRRQTSIPSAGYSTPGVSQNVRVSTSAQPMNIEYALKSASGFGGANAAIVWKHM